MHAERGISPAFPFRDGHINFIKPAGGSFGVTPLSCCARIVPGTMETQRLLIEDDHSGDYHSNGVLFAFAVSAEGQATLLPTAELLPPAPRESGLLWIHLNRSAEPARRWLSRFSGLEEEALEAMLEDETRPSWQVYGKGIVVVLSDLRYDLGRDMAEMGSLRLWIDRTRIISIRRRPMRAVKRLRNEIERGQPPVSPGELFTRLLEHQIDSLDPVVAAMTDSVDDIEDEMLAGRTDELRGRLGRVRRQAVRLRRHIVPQRRALSQMLSRQPGGLFDEGDLRHLRETVDDAARQLEDVDAAHERAKVLQDELAALIGEESNHNLFILSVVTVVFAPLTLLTGVFGMNVGGLPGTHSHWGFLAVCLLMIATGIATLWWLRRKRWF